MYLSYSGYTTHKDCPYQYYHKYVAKTFVAGENVITSLYGSTVGSVFEDFYSLGLGSSPDCLAALRGRVRGALDKAYAGGVKQGRGLWWKGERSSKLEVSRDIYANEQELLADIDQGIVNGLTTIREFHLFGPRVGAEVKLDVKVGPHTLGGRADFIAARASPRVQGRLETLILDGKGSKHRDRYASPVQLQWYAMLYELKYGIPPDRLGFVFWRFRGLESLQWEPFEVLDLRVLLGSVLDCMDRLEVSAKMVATGADPVVEYPPKAGRDPCFLCSYNKSGLCEFGAEFRKK